MAFGTATPLTMFHPCVAKRYEPLSVYTPQGCGPSAARAVPDVPSAIAATRLTNAHPKSKEAITRLTNFIFISLISFCLGFIVLTFIGFSS
jgi:hypothetical protein